MDGSIVRSLQIIGLSSRALSRLLLLAAKDTDGGGLFRSQDVPRPGFRFLV
jgi:hypothetical protein